MTSIIYENDFFKVQLTNNILGLDNLKGGVVILPVTDDNHVLLINVFRERIGKLSLELPRGFKEIGEESIQSAKRELFEETNVYAQQIISLGSIYPDSGLVNAEIDLFLAKGVKIDGLKLEIAEGIKEYALMKFSDVIDLALNGKIKDAFSLSAILRAQKYLLEK